MSFSPYERSSASLPLGDLRGHLSDRKCRWVRYKRPFKSTSNDFRSNGRKDLWWRIAVVVCDGQRSVRDRIDSRYLRHAEVISFVVENYLPETICPDAYFRLLGRIG